MLIPSYDRSPRVESLLRLAGHPISRRVITGGVFAMIFKRAVAKLRAQDWAAITIELGIVIVGVFIGTWVANWNQERAARRDTRTLLLQLKPEMAQQKQFVTSARKYFATTQRYAAIAFAGWRGDASVGDADFVIAAYQASQAYGLSSNEQNWTTIFGGDQLRRIDDPAIRAPLQRLMTFDNSILSYRMLLTRYRDDVRLVIPNDVQQLIRNSCDDRLDANGLTLSLPATCRIDIPSAGQVAAKLRAHPELVAELAQHEGAVATHLTNLGLFEAQVDALDAGIKRLQ